MLADSLIFPKEVSEYMTCFPTTPSDTDNDERHDDDEQREALSLHAESEKVLRVVFKVAEPVAENPRRSYQAHRYYRAILRGPSGEFHLAGGHVVIDGDGGYAEDATTGSEPRFWVERCLGLGEALHAVNNFIPRHRGGGTLIAPQFLKGRRKCHVLWQLMRE